MFYIFSVFSCLYKMFCFFFFVMIGKKKKKLSLISEMLPIFILQGYQAILSELDDSVLLALCQNLVNALFAIRKSTYQRKLSYSASYFSLAWAQKKISMLGL